MNIIEILLKCTNYSHCSCSLAENVILILSNSVVIQNLINMNSIHIHVIIIILEFCDTKNILNIRNLHFQKRSHFMLILYVNSSSCLCMFAARSVRALGETRTS